ncbi:Hypothetical protein R9X50_00079600 [Acrodontium crateriforme]|uniref:KilA/APSES-type HTH DNA-binding domain-containing protein n=1 Tax=Acrodontium crateriforme TaxID=150365 RepID=A0AAQ3M0X4_9PEZI|nr:Hypothetical protein R9X50_00079600 [Acrodontium crateriforme]
MASAATAMPPTPNQSFSHMAPAGSPTGSQSAYGHAYNMSFDGSQSGSQAMSFSQSFPNGPVANPGYARSFGEGAYGYRGNEKPQIYTAVYSGVSVYEMEVHNVACMRRRSDGWLNATQILKVAGVDKGKRTKVLEKEILTGEHEKVQGGYGKYQGTWISYRRGREFCRQYGVEELLRPLLEYDVAADGSGGQGQETPTKEQAMAANRKRFYNTGVDSRQNGGQATNGGTFFQNISPTTSVALAAMNKVGRLNSPAPRLSSMRHQSQQDPFQQSQQSMLSNGSFALDGSYGNQANGEPPRKRMRPDNHENMAPPTLPLDVSMQSVTPTEPNESFMYEDTTIHEPVIGNNDSIAKPPLPTPTTDEQHDKLNLILDLFAEPGRVDYGTHQALTQLSGEDLNMPLDASANNALHWAATLAKVPLLKLLIEKGANIWRGNAAGQSPLISAVLVNNCWEHSSFPELLEHLGPLIEVRDLQGRTILHHIAVSSGIKGRAPSSKYYLEALLEFLVRIGTQPNSNFAGDSAASIAAAAVANMQLSNGEILSQDVLGGSQGSKGAVNLVRFISHIVNARDKAGNTALNLVARIGNRSIIQQLLEIHADPTLPNYKGVSAKDFGVGVESGDQSQVNGMNASQQPTQSSLSTQEVAVVDRSSAATEGIGVQVEDLRQDVILSMTSMLTQTLASHNEVLRERTEQIDRLNEQIRDLSAQQKAELEKVQVIRDRVKLRSERQAKIANLKRAISDRRSVKMQQKRSAPSTDGAEIDPPWLNSSSQEIIGLSNSGDQPNNVQRQFLDSKVPVPSQLRAQINARTKHNAELQSKADELRSRSSELEEQYRKVVSLCTGVSEERVEEQLSALVAAVESEKGGLGEREVGRVREFLRRVDGAHSFDAAIE